MTTTAWGSNAKPLTPITPSFQPPSTHSTCTEKVESSNLQHDLRLLRCLVVGCPDAEIFLVLLAVHSFMDGSARQAVLVTTHGAAEEVDEILVDAPALAVRSLAVVAVDLLALCQVQAAAQEALVHLVRHQLRRELCSLIRSVCNVFPCEKHWDAVPVKGCSSCENSFTQSYHCMHDLWHLGTVTSAVRMVLLPYLHSSKLTWYIKKYLKNQTHLLF